MSEEQITSIENDKIILKDIDVAQSLNSFFSSIVTNLKIPEYTDNTVPEACKFIKKETLVQVFTCEFCEISKNTFSYRTPPVAGSDNNLNSENITDPIITFF